MKVIWLFSLLAIALVMVNAEEKVPEGFQHWTGASLKELAEILKSEADASTHHMSMRPLGDFPQDKFMLSRRQADGIPEWHEIRLMFSSCNPVRQRSWWAARWWV